MRTAHHEAAETSADRTSPGETPPVQDGSAAPATPIRHRWLSQLGAIGVASVAFVLTVLLSGGTSPLLAVAGAVAIGAGVIVVLVLAEHDTGIEWILRRRPRRARPTADRPEERLPAGR